MDEVKTMTHAGETAGRAVGTGLRTLRRGAVQVGQAGAEAAARAVAVAEQKLAEGADSGQQAAADLVGTTRRARKQLAKSAQRTARKAGKQGRRAAKDLGKQGQQTAKDMGRQGRKAAKDMGKQGRKAAKDLGKRGRKATRGMKDVVSELATNQPARRGRRWPWLVGLAVAAAGTAYVVRSRQSQLPEPVLVEDVADRERIATNGSATNGSATMPRQERQEQPNEQLNRRN
jgi:hypothetical protein